MKIRVMIHEILYLLNNHLLFWVGYIQKYQYKLLNKKPYANKIFVNKFRCMGKVSLT